MCVCAAKRKKEKKKVFVVFGGFDLTGTMNECVRCATERG